MKVGTMLLAATMLLGAPDAASAEVLNATPASFDIRQVVTIDAPIAQTWATLLVPATWWDHEHTYSDDSANLSLQPQAPGCFCERLPASNGSIEHARVHYIQPPRMLRMVGSLGPLQAEAVTGTLTFRLDPETDRTTRVTLEYVVGGYVRAGADTLAPKVDEVLAAQLIGLKAAAEAGAATPAPKRKVEPGTR